VATPYQKTLFVAAVVVVVAAVAVVAYC